LNIVLIPKFNFYGAAIATLCSSYLSVAIQFVIMGREINLKILLSPFIKYLLMAVIMFIVAFAATYQMNPSVLKTIVQILIGCSCYMLQALFIKDEVFFKILKEKSIV